MYSCQKSILNGPNKLYKLEYSAHYTLVARRATSREICKRRFLHVMTLYGQFGTNVSHLVPFFVFFALQMPGRKWPLMSITALIGNVMPTEVWYEITYLFPSFNGATDVVLEWIINFTPHLINKLIYAGIKGIHVSERYLIWRVWKAKPVTTSCICCDLRAYTWSESNGWNQTTNV